MNIINVNRNTAPKDIDVFKDVIRLDLSVPKDIFPGFFWWDFISFVHKYFPEEYVYGCSSSGSYDKLVVQCTAEEAIFMIEEYCAKNLRYFKKTNLYTGQARRLLKCYVNKLARGKDIVCFERYLMKNVKWD